MQFRTVLFFLLAMALSVASAPAPSKLPNLRQALPINPHVSAPAQALKAMLSVILVSSKAPSMPSK